MLQSTCHLYYRYITLYTCSPVCCSPHGTCITGKSPFKPAHLYAAVHMPPVLQVHHPLHLLTCMLQFTCHLYYRYITLYTCSPVCCSSRATCITGTSPFTPAHLYAAVHVLPVLQVHHPLHLLTCMLQFTCYLYYRYITLYTCSPVCCSPHATCITDTSPFTPAHLYAAVHMPPVLQTHRLSPHLLCQVADCSSLHGLALVQLDPHSHLKATSEYM